MRICVVGPTHPIKGGISHYTTLLVRALRKNHDVLFQGYAYQYPSIIYPGTSQTSEDDSPIIEDAEFIWHTLKPWTLTKIARRVKEFKCDLVVLSWVTHFFGWHIARLAHLIHKIAGCPVVLLCHNVKQHEDRPLEGPLTRMAFDSVDAYIVHSQEDYDNLLSIRPDAVIRKNFHPTYDIFASAAEWTRSDARVKLELDDQYMVLYFGAVRPYKGLKWLVEAAWRIVSSIPGTQIWCVGDYWDGTGDFEKQAESLGILFNPDNPPAGGVRFINRYTPNEEVGMYFMASDLVVLPYESATQSGIVQIAYGFAKPCLVTDVGGLPEVVLDGKTGYVVPPKDPDAIAEKVIEFQNASDETRNHFELEIIEWRKAFDWEHMVNTIETLHSTLSK